MIARADEDALTQVILTLAAQYGRYGYRLISKMLNDAGWQAGTGLVQRIWRQEGLKVPQKQKPRGRLWLNDSSCIRLRPEHHNHVWTYDFVEAQTHDGRKLRLLTLIDEFTRPVSLTMPTKPCQKVPQRFPEKRGILHLQAGGYITI